jgi:hypothetical protein
MFRARTLSLLACLVALVAACHDDPAGPVAPKIVAPADTNATLMLFNPAGVLITDIRIADCEATDTGFNLIDQRVDANQPLFALEAAWRVQPGCHDVYVQSIDGQSWGWFGLQFAAQTPMFLVLNASGIPFVPLSDSDVGARKP